MDVGGMYPEDRVLVGVMPDPEDLLIAQERGWYRVPVKHAPTGIHAEYVAFYFTKRFPPELRWAIHYYARRTGHELVRRVDLLPDQPDHPRANEVYYKLQLGPLKRREPPIVSLRWRRITFIQTTWDRFMAAREINDLFRSEARFVDRIYHALRDRGIQPERNIEVRERGTHYTLDMLIPCRDGAVWVSAREERPVRAVKLIGDMQADMEGVNAEIERRGGALMIDLP